MQTIQEFYVKINIDRARPKTNYTKPKSLYTSMRLAFRGFYSNILKA